VGYDSRESLGNKETGAVTALPIWIDFMRAAISGKDDEQFPGDEENASLSRAAIELPARLPMQAPATKSAWPVRQRTLVVKPALGPAQKPTTKPAKKSEVKPALTSNP
jgi:penicillin-binding protein 1A